MHKENRMHIKRAEISKMIIDKRKQLNISQADLAEKTGIGIATVKRMEDPDYWPGLKQLLIVCHALDMDVTIEE